MKKYLYICLGCVMMCSLCACGITKQKLGFARQGPDETQVQTNQPLILPPEYNVRPKVNNKTDEDNGSYFQDDDE